MNQKRKIATVSLLVDDYDKAIAFYTNVLSFSLIEDTKMNDSKRWVLVAPQESECSILLAKASDEEQKKYIGRQTGGRVFLFLHTDNFERDYKNLLENKVNIIRQPSNEVYGRVLVFEDIYGNLWDLIEPK
ncbi:MAG: VOC family protein [Chitinophagaceae bacterium]|nr:VOC family protein [Chitinophagaceae bacterium]